MDSDFLRGHEVTKEIRIKMISWMEVVQKAAKLSDQTFFIAVNLMDNYFYEAQKELTIVR